MSLERPRIPFIDMERRWAPVADDVRAALDAVLKSGYFLDGPDVESLETEFAAYTGYRFGVAVGSGTDALRLSLAAVDVGPGDEVIVPAFTAVPTAAAVSATGATPVPVDVAEGTGELDPAAAAAAVTSRTKAVVPVHLYGRPAPIPDLGVPVVEDAAQAHGALLPGSAAAVAYSFYPTKNLGGITDGGMVVTDDQDVANSVRAGRSHGAGRGYRHEIVATNSRLSSFAAAALLILLPRLDAGNARRRLIVDRYRVAAPGLRWQQGHDRHVYHLCVARFADRDSLRRAVPFDTAVHYPLALTQQPAYRGFVREPCPQAEAWAAECVSLPCFPELTDNEVDVVCAALGRLP